MRLWVSSGVPKELGVVAHTGIPSTKETGRGRSGAQVHLQHEKAGGQLEINETFLKAGGRRGGDSQRNAQRNISLRYSHRTLEQLSMTCIRHKAPCLPER